MVLSKKWIKFKLCKIFSHECVCWFQIQILIFSKNDLFQNAAISWPSRMRAISPRRNGGVRSTSSTTVLYRSRAEGRRMAMVAKFWNFFFKIKSKIVKHRRLKIWLEKLFLQGRVVQIIERLLYLNILKISKTIFSVPARASIHLEYYTSPIDVQRRPVAAAAAAEKWRQCGSRHNSHEEQQQGQDEPPGQQRQPGRWGQTSCCYRDG